MSEELATTAVQPFTLTEEQKQQWLDAIREEPQLGNREIMVKLGVTVERHYTSRGNTPRTTQAPPTSREINALLADDDDLNSRYLEARGRAPERIHAEITRRAIDGVEEDVYHDGQVVGQKVVYSDRLLALMAKAHLPEYRDVTRLEHSGVGGGPLGVTVEHDYRIIIAGLEDIGLLRPGSAAALEPAPHDHPASPPVLPARTD